MFTPRAGCKIPIKQNKSISFYSLTREVWHDRSPCVFQNQLLTRGLSDVLDQVLLHSGESFEQSSLIIPVISEGELCVFLFSSVFVLPLSCVFLFKAKLTLSFCVV